MSAPESLNTDPADLPDAYARLRRIAQKLLAGERAQHTLSATDVVHEALNKLLSGGETLPQSGPEFITFVSHAARAMTEVLIDHSRRKNAVKRGGGRGKVRLDDLNDVQATIDDRPSFDWARLDSAMNELEQVDSRRHQVMVLRFFGGLDNRQIARQLHVDERTVGRDFSAARLWLKEKLSDAV